MRKAVGFASLGCMALTFCAIKIWPNPNVSDPASLISLVILAILFVGGLLSCFLCLLLSPISRAGILGLMGVLIAGWTIVHLYLLCSLLPLFIGHTVLISQEALGCR
jgi:hypothetical protein